MQAVTNRWPKSEHEHRGFLAWLQKVASRRTRLMVGLDPADVAQEVYLRVLEASEHRPLGDAKSVRRYSSAILRNIVYTNYRRYHRWHSLAAAHELSSELDDPLSRASQDELLAMLKEALLQLPSFESEVVRMHIACDMPLSQVATELKCSRSKVSRVHLSALIRLRRLLRASRLTEPSSIDR